MKQLLPPHDPFSITHRIHPPIPSPHASIPLSIQPSATITAPTPTTAATTPPTLTLPALPGLLVVDGAAVAVVDVEVGEVPLVRPRRTAIGAIWPRISPFGKA